MVLEARVFTGTLKAPVARLLSRATQACSAPRSLVAWSTAAARAAGALHDARKRSMVTCQSASVFCEAGDEGLHARAQGGVGDLVGDLGRGIDQRPDERGVLLVKLVGDRAVVGRGVGAGRGPLRSGLLQQGQVDEDGLVGGLGLAPSLSTLVRKAFKRAVGRRLHDGGFSVIPATPGFMPCSAAGRSWAAASTDRTASSRSVCSACTTPPGPTEALAREDSWLTVLIWRTDVRDFQPRHRDQDDQRQGEGRNQLVPNMPEHGCLSCS